ncbi:homeodomain-interacting protein kinase 1-like isoform X2 [Thunnus maccoyii]|nr:homeodomain-interacting protein kinase 1-like isoform X2 [Thunnus maccoyii]
MRLQDVRTIIQQMAVAFDALKSIGVIHTDVRTNNIMLVDRVRPFRVKLIGFDMAIPSHKAEKSRVDHGSFYRAPEIMLGLPFSEAINMWSLGCVMAETPSKNQEAEPESNEVAEPNLNQEAEPGTNEVDEPSMEGDENGFWGNVRRTVPTGVIMVQPLPPAFSLPLVELVSCLREAQAEPGTNEAEEGY